MRHFVVKAKELHVIAFFQWRHLCPPDGCCSPGKAELESLLEQRVHTLQVSQEEYTEASTVTKEAAALPQNFYKNYKSLFKKKLAHFNINCLRQIGVPDPFPDEDSHVCLDSIPINPMGQGYQYCRYVKEHSPACLYIPSKQVMFKLMRACIHVEGPQDLWFN